MIAVTNEIEEYGGEKIRKRDRFKEVCARKREKST